MVKPSSRINHTSMENHKIDHEPHLSGAYIRTLVKHLTSIKPKDHSSSDNHNFPESVNSNDNNTQQETPPPPPPATKKQVRRRRRQTSKPYQERLLNMAEARREIVTALKFHRASMKQRETAPAVTASGNYLECCSNLPYSPHHWQMCTTSPPPPPPPPPPPIIYENNHEFILPNQTLGLNLNFQDFVNLDNTNLYHNPISNYATSSSCVCCSAATFVATEEVSVDVPLEVAAATTTSDGSTSSGTIEGDLHHAVDDDGMEEIRSLGEQHQIEWNDTVNLLTSARWLEFLESIEKE